jgi:hypothetical protein
MIYHRITLKKICLLMLFGILFTEKTFASQPVLSQEDAFIFSVIKKRLAEVKEHLANGVDVNYPLQNGDTALTEAAIAGDIPMMKLLLGHGAFVDPKGKDFITPLHCATANSHLKGTLLLIVSGANIAFVDLNKIHQLHAKNLSAERKLIKLIIMLGQIATPKSFNKIVSFPEEIAAAIAQELPRLEETESSQSISKCKSSAWHQDHETITLLAQVLEIMQLRPVTNQEIWSKQFCDAYWDLLARCKQTLLPNI